MRLASFDVLRTLDFPGIRHFKPEHLFRHKTELAAADWVLFPQYWQLGALIYGLKCRIFPSAATYLIGHNKIEMTRAFESVAAAHVPLTLIEANDPEQRQRLWDIMTLPFVAKLPKASQGEGVWLIETLQDWQRYCQRSDVLYVQEYLPIDRDLRVVLVGEQIVAAYWRRQAQQGFYNNISRGGEIDSAPVPAAALQLVRRVATQLNINHAGFDVAMVGEQPYLFEFNRLFGNRGIATPGLLRDAILDYLQKHREPQDPDNNKPLRPPPIDAAQTG